MKNQNNPASEISHLRQQAEMQLQPTVPISELSEEETQKLFHELEVHQIELELQNQELQLAVSAAEDAVNLYDFAPVGYFTLSPTGEIISLNFNGAEMLGKDRSGLIHSNFKFFISNDTRSAFNVFLDKVFQSKVKKSCEVILSVDDKESMYVQLDGIATHNGEQCLLTVVDVTIRKKAEQTLSESEKRYRLLLDNTLTGILITRPDGTILAANPEACRMFGRTETEICQIGRDGVVDLTNPNLRKALEKRQQTGHFHGELTYVRSDGSVFPVDVESGIYTGSNGQTYAYNFFQDITDRKNASDALKESEANIQALFNASNDSIFLITADETILAVNEIAAQRLGQPKEKLIGQKIYDWLPTEVVTSRRPFFNHAMQTGEIVKFEDERAGHSLSTNLYPILDTNGNVIRLAIYSSDITERKQAEETIHQSQVFLNNIIENSPNMLWISDENGTMIRMNQACRDHLYIQDEEVVGIYNILNDNLIKEQGLMPLVKDVFEKGVTVRFETSYDTAVIKSVKLKKTTRIFLEVNISPILNHQGKVTNAVIQEIDITDRKQAEEALLNQQNLLKKLAQFSIDLSKLSSEENLEMFICKQIREFTGAVGVLFSQYDEDTRLVAPKHIEMESGLLGKVVRRLDNRIQDMRSILDDESYQRITQSIIVTYNSLTDATFGTVLRPVGAILSKMLKAERYVGLSYMVDGKLYGTSLMTMGKEQADLPIEFLENIASLIAVSLRRKRAEESLKDSEYKYKLLTESNSDVVFIIDKFGKLLFVNESVKLVLGYDPEDVLGKLLTKFVYEKQVPEAFLQLANAFIHKEVTGFVTKIYHKDRHLIDVEINGKIVIFNGQTVGQGTIRDITEKKRTEEKLMLSLDRNKALLGANPDMMFVFDSDCRIVDFHAESFDKLYAEPDFFLNKTADEIVPPEVALMTHECVNAVLSTGKPDYSTYDLRMGDALRTYESRYVLCGKNEVLSIVRDITDRKLAEEELLNRKQQYDELVSKIPVGIYILHTKSDGAFALDYVSPRMAKMLSLSVKSLLADNQTIFKAIHPDDVDGFRTLSQDGIFKHRPFNWKGRIVADGNVKWMHFRSTPEPLEDGDTLWHGLIVDITERVNAEQEIELKNEELTSLIAEKDKFFSVLAHDLRSPFNSILGFTQMLEEDLPNMEFDQIKHIVSVLRNSAFGAYSLLENLLEWSRMKRGITNFSPEQFLLQSNIEVSLQSVMELARKKWIEVSINIPEELQAFADPNMLGSIIRNLTTNAIKFTPKYGTVLISAQVNDDQNIEISVKDSGIGMNQNILSKLFSNDELANRRGTDGESSSGLGLIICKDFVEKHGGKIWAKSEVGKGSTLYFTLPHPMNV